MPRSKTGGLNVSRVKRSDGTVVEYFYDRATGRFLGHDRESALAMRGGTPIVNPSASSASRSLAELVMLYYKSDLFRNLSHNSKLLYKRCLDQALINWGRLPVRAFKRSDFKQLKLIQQETPHATNNLLRVLRIVFNFAVEDLEWIEANPVKKPGLIAVKPRLTVWDQAAENRFLAAARPSLRLGFALMLHTAQRVSDVLAMTTNNVWEREDGKLFISIRQEKTDKVVNIPVNAALEPLLRERLAQATDNLLLVPSPRGLHWSRRNFSRAWDMAIRDAGLSGIVQRRDLRRTAVTALSMAGATPQEIAEITGHDLAYTAKILETYLGHPVEIAEAGMKKWDAAIAKGPRRMSVVQLATRRPKR